MELLLKFLFWMLKIVLKKSGCRFEIEQTTKKTRFTFYED